MAQAVKKEEQIRKMALKAKADKANLMTETLRQKEKDVGEGEGQVRRERS